MSSAIPISGQPIPPAGPARTGRSTLRSALLSGLLAAALLCMILGSARAAAVDPASIRQSSRSDKPLLTLNFHQNNINEILSALAMQQQVNIVTSTEVMGDVSIHLYDVTLERALQAICSAGGFRVHRRDDVYYVYKPGRNAGAAAGKREMRIFKLRFADIDKIQEVLAAVPDIRMVKIHEPTRTVIVEDTAENIRRIETIINHWDARPRQVLIEAKILEVTLTDEMTLGVNWEKVLGDATIGTGGFSSGTLPDSGPASPVPSTGLGFFGNMITGAGTSHQFRAALDALGGKTRIDTLSTPKILAIHGKAARVQVGGQQGYRVTTTNLGVATETIEFIDTGTILEITPYIDEKGNILLNVKPTINTAKIEEGIPVVNSTVVSTWLLARNGETALIGGLIQEEAVETQTAIPCLGSIPGLGYLFGRKSHGTGKSELVVLITPTVLHDGHPQVPGAMEKTRQSQKQIERQRRYSQPWRRIEEHADPAYGEQDHEQ
jgi:type II secretory pathway component GspD/PulD (secretin)